MADLLVVTKADGDYLQKADQAVGYFSGLLGTQKNTWRQKIQKVSALSKTGIAELHKQIESFKNSIDLDLERQERAAKWLRWRLNHEIIFAMQEKLSSCVEREATALRSGKTNPSSALANCRRDLNELINS